MYKPIFDRDKFRDLMLYLAHECRDADYFGSTKLCKLLYYCDFSAFLRNGRPITGADYVKQAHGPMPARFYEIRNELVSDRQATVESRTVYHHTQDRLVPAFQDASELELRLAQDADEMKSIKETLTVMKDMTAAEASEYSHGELGWIVAQIGDTIPYESAYFVSENDHDLNAIIDAALASWKANVNAPR